MCIPLFLQNHSLKLATPKSLVPNKLFISFLSH